MTVGFAAAVALLALAGSAASSTRQTSTQIYSANAGAEDGTTAGWSGTGWGAERYSDAGVSVIYGYPDYWNPAVANRWLFASTAAKQALTQTVSVGGAADEIDSGADRFFVAAWLGGAGAGGGAQFSAQPLDANGHALGSPVTLGPPTVADRHGKKALTDCAADLDLVPGTRQVLLTLKSTASTGGADLALADNLLLGDHGWFQAGGRPQAQGAHCYLQGPAQPTATPTASPTPAPTYATPRTARVSKVRLTRRRLSFITTARAYFRVTISRRGRTERRFAVDARRDGAVSHRVRRLSSGRYKIVIKSAGRLRASAVRLVR